MSFAQSEFAGIAFDQAMQANRNKHLSDVNELERIIYEYKNSQAKILALRCAMQEVIKNLTGANHPILVDMNLRERIGNAGVTAINMTNDWDAVKRAGASFKLPPEANIDVHKACISKEDYEQMTQNAQTALEYSKIHKSNAEALQSKLQIADAERESLKKMQVETNAMLVDEFAKVESLIKKLQDSEAKNVKANAEIENLERNLAMHMAQSAAFRNQLTAVNPTNPLIVDPGLRQRVADVAYEQLKAASSNIDGWRAVREVGASFVSAEERDRSNGSSD